MIFQNPSDRFIGLEGSLNFRDFGGYPTASGGHVIKGHLFRCGMLSDFTADGAAEFEALNIGVICDLRGTDEVALYPTPNLPMFDCQKHIPIAPGTSSDLRGSVAMGQHSAAERSAFPIYGNAVQATLKDNTLELTPSFFEKMTARDSVGSKFKRLHSANAFSYNQSQWQKKDTLTRPFITSDSLFVKLLSESTGNEVVLADKPRDDLPWEELYSDDDAPLYRALLQDSDNGIAEALLLMIGQEKFKEMDSQRAIDSILAIWKPWLLDPIAWVDGSGVSRYNMITPRTLVGVLQKIHETVGWETIQNYFPQGASSGTLKKYDNASVFAKTGTLRHNHNLSGYLVHPKGTTYAFSIMVNHHTAEAEEVRAGIGTLLKWLERKLK